MDSEMFIRIATVISVMLIVVALGLRWFITRYDFSKNGRLSRLSAAGYQATLAADARTEVLPHCSGDLLGH